ncbi:N-acetylmuramate alpha-1-phosphate uridylyltransferase MurU [Chromohalobacter nigrandesensis]|uniref:N-acetylmuramate alpha-1-phosphate uridylyltransferase MurU n=1 Tax=Chromohalobacter nigrandesensis TaxID=119863 RepID=UPI001FF32BB3|nr:nucleotidyltransferase family protein [Chromohalobacter nigrandesensis]MCK0744419.1 nucleotidyltransferase family protein [Chromohalobacter nigrandesensis]
MKAMILAAGMGTRMRPLTDHCPKPLLSVADKPLIVHHLERLATAGITDIVINVSYRAEQIVEALGDGQRFDVSLAYSHETTPLETAGGIRHALPLLGEAPFLLINGDVWCDIALETLPELKDDLAHLVLVANPDHHAEGDFALDDAGRVRLDSTTRLTYAGLAILDPALVASLPDNVPAKLAPLLREAIASQRVGGTHHRGGWVDVGTPERLETLDTRLRGI